MRRSDGVSGVMGMTGRGRRVHHVVIALSSCLAGCAGLLGIGDDYCSKGTDGCGPPPTVPSANQPRPPPPPSDASPPLGEPDASEPDAGVLDAPATSDCDRYCEAITTQCLGDRADYARVDGQEPLGRAECRALCPHFALAPASPQSTNTLQCRLNIVLGPLGETSDCRAAGRGGNGVCGTYCESYCQLMRSICPFSFDIMTASASCESLCDERLVDRRDYDAIGAETDAPSVQCRLWHLGRAAITPTADNGMLTNGNMHCLHAAGLLPPCGELPVDAGAR